MPQSPGDAPNVRCLCATVRRASRLLNRRYEEALRPAGLTPAQFELMMTLRQAGPRDQAALANLLEADQTTLSRNLATLLRERWIAGAIDKRDARRRSYSLTPMGLAVLGKAQRCWEGINAEMARLAGEPSAMLWPVLDHILAAARLPGS